MEPGLRCQRPRHLGDQPPFPPHDAARIRDRERRLRGGLASDPRHGCLRGIQGGPVSTKQSVTGFEDYLIKRQASADEIAAYICFLGSSDAGYITGAAVAVDGGRTLH
jgi:NAD(P)-dependent dehydrogenase (short-subunit alcohol dehydrogenase family)